MNFKQLHKAALHRVAGLAIALIATVAFISGCSEGFGNADRVVRAEGDQLTIAEETGLSEKTHEVAPDAEIVLDGQPATLEELESGDAVKLTVEQRDGVEVVKKIEAKSKEVLEAEPATDPIDRPVAPIGPLPDQPSSDNPKQPSGLNPYPEEPPQETGEPIDPEDDQPIDPEDGAPQVDANADAEQDAALAEEPFSGKISSLGDDQFVVHDDSDVERTFMVNDETSYKLDGNEATFDDLMVGHSASVTAEKEGDNYVAKTVDAISDVAPK